MDNQHHHNRRITHHGPACREQSATRFPTTYQSGVPVPEEELEGGSSVAEIISRLRAVPSATCQSFHLIQCLHQLL
jgi:hypothetical protein